MTAGVVEAGSEVTLHYTLSLVSGRVVETTREGAPAVVVMGAADLPSAIERRLLGMRVGERHEFELAGSDVYGGTPGEDNTRAMARTEFPPDIVLVPGLVIGFEVPDGSEVPGVVREVSDHEVVVDFTHPLAGHGLLLDVEIISVTGRPQTSDLPIDHG